jgi:hypothetical protein
LPLCCLESRPHVLVFATLLWVPLL